MTMPRVITGIDFDGTHCIRIVVMNTYITQKVEGSVKKIAVAGLIFALQTEAAAFDVTDQLLERVREEHGVVAESRLLNWQKMIKQSGAKLDIDKLTMVNEFVNRAHQVIDRDSWRKSDTLANPVEFLINHSGDGQDFTVAKLFTLHRMGLDLAKLRISYVKSNRSNRPHTVLAYFSSPTAEPLILDNIDQRIKPASARTDLEPLYLFDARDILLIDVDSRQLPVTKSNHIVQWRNLLPNYETVQY